MNRKEQFLNAVRVLAPDDQFMYQTAQQVPEQSLPMFPGGAALEFVAAVQKLRRLVERIPVKSAGGNKKYSRRRSTGQGRLPVPQAVRVKSAELWLKLGEADQALRELEALPSSAWNHPAAVLTRAEALDTVHNQSEVTVQE